MINQVVLAGRVTQTPRRIDGAAGPAVELQLEVERGARWGALPETCAVTVWTFGRRVESIQKYLPQGSSCLIEGRLRSEGPALVVVADQVQFIEDHLQSRPLEREAWAGVSPVAALPPTSARPGAPATAAVESVGAAGPTSRMAAAGAAAALRPGTPAPRAVAV